MKLAKTLHHSLSTSSQHPLKSHSFSQYDIEDTRTRLPQLASNSLDKKRGNGALKKEP